MKSLTVNVPENCPASPFSMGDKVSFDDDISRGIGEVCGFCYLGENPEDVNPGWRYFVAIELSNHVCSKMEFFHEDDLRLFVETPTPVLTEVA